MSSPTQAEIAADADVYRTVLREWLEEGHADAWRDSYQYDIEASIKNNGKLVKLLFESGVGAYGWPVEAGALGGGSLHLATLFDELSRRGIPIPEHYGVLTTLGPPLVRYAPELAKLYLAAFLRGEEWWGQSFSEPEAGSDMASLRCRATPVDGGYRVNGQKIWTSHGVGAKKIVLLARTGTPESRHRGLTLFLIDSDTPGLEIRPIALANGRNELAEVFFDDVFVPTERRIGAEDEGWAIAMYLLQFERGLWAWLRAGVLMNRLGELARTVEPTDAAKARIGELYLDVAALRARAAETAKELADNGEVGPGASVDKLLLGAAEVGMLNAARELLGDTFLYGDTADRWREEWWWSRTTTIYGGAAEAQRQIIADRVLNLPKEPRK
ncbi:MAG: putative acyl-CoA dehydrogenase [Microbacteriaceae bacterium]|nr:putative acyl-CoA dehydrogenase [Microbacteriaceae bacterium]